MSLIKNLETEDFCQQIAIEYQSNPLKANQLFIDFVNEKKLVKWVWHAMQSRIQYIIEQNKGNRL